MQDRRTALRQSRQGCSHACGSNDDADLDLGLTDAAGAEPKHADSKKKYIRTSYSESERERSASDYIAWHILL